MHIRSRVMHFKEKMLNILLLIFFTVFCFSQNINASTASPNEANEVRVPITLKVPYAIAGAEFEIEYTPGLKLLSFEKSETIGTAYTTPMVEKNGRTYFGFYHGSNDYAPKDGVLDIGFLVFEHSGEPDQFILVKEAKYVQVIDKDNTNSSLLTLNEKIDVSPVSDPTTNPKPDPESNLKQMQYALWMILCGATVAAAVVIFFYVKRKKVG
ncbi:MAG TPA: hypothetical protein GX505_13765 [Clostridiales bacterium]|nr:hypothetical protein [Clostridiales bacterium]